MVAPRPVRVAFAELPPPVAAFAREARRRFHRRDACFRNARGAVLGLAAPLGTVVRYVEGWAGRRRVPHAWVEVTLDARTFIVDPTWGQRVRTGAYRAELRLSAAQLRSPSRASS